MFSAHFIILCWYAFMDLCFFEKVSWFGVENGVEYFRRFNGNDDSFCMKLCDSHIGDLYTDTSELRATNNEQSLIPCSF